MNVIVLRSLVVPLEEIMTEKNESSGIVVRVPIGKNNYYREIFKKPVPLRLMCSYPFSKEALAELIATDSLSDEFLEELDT